MLADQICHPFWSPYSNNTVNTMTKTGKFSEAMTHMSVPSKISMPQILRPSLKTQFSKFLPGVLRTLVPFPPTPIISSPLPLLKQSSKIYKCIQNMEGMALLANISTNFNSNEIEGNMVFQWYKKLKLSDKPFSSILE